jgi:hypothetical protein
MRRAAAGLAFLLRFTFRPEKLMLATVKDTDIQNKQDPS